ESTVTDLSRAGRHIVIVNDGSGGGYAEIFDRCRRVPGVEVIEHPTHRGKGAALRTGFQHLLRAAHSVDGIVTADADGQHLSADIVRVAERLRRATESLVLGTRQFATAPLKSRLGNETTRVLFRLLHGEDLKDTQTGLRGVPRAL